jgi:hypothetical protein
MRVRSRQGGGRPSSDGGGHNFLFTQILTVPTYNLVTHKDLDGTAYRI